MNVRSKWQCLSVKKYSSNTWDETGQKMKPGVLYAYEFQVVTGGANEENKKFFASTPGGNMSMSAVRDDLYEPGQYYYFDSSPADNGVI